MNAAILAPSSVSSRNLSSAIISFPLRENSIGLSLCFERMRSSVLASSGRMPAARSAFRTSSTQASSSFGSSTSANVFSSSAAMPRWESAFIFKDDDFYAPVRVLLRHAHARARLVALHARVYNLVNICQLDFHVLPASRGIKKVSKRYMYLI